MSTLSDLTRREVPGVGAAVGAFALAYESLGGSLLASAGARVPRCSGGLRDDEHIVVLM